VLVIVAPDVDHHTAQAMKWLRRRGVDIRLDTLDTAPELLLKLAPRPIARGRATRHTSRWRRSSPHKRRPELIDFCDAYFPRFKWDFVPSELLLKLYEEDPSYPAPGGRFYTRLANSVDEYDGWEKFYLTPKTIGFCSGEEPLALQLGWELPSPFTRKAGYLRIAARAESVPRHS